MYQWDSIKRKMFKMIVDSAVRCQSYLQNDDLESSYVEDS